MSIRLSPALQPLTDRKSPDPDLPEAWIPVWKSFARALRALNRSERTLIAYGYALRDLARFLGSTAPPLHLVERAQLEDFMVDLQARLNPGGVAIHFRGLRRLFNWMVEEEDIEASPMRRMRAPNVPDAPLQVLDLEDIRKLLDACKGREFQDRRDGAIFRFLIDTGVRRAGLIAMLVDDVDLDRQTAIITLKGGDRHEVVFGVKTTRDLDRYLRARAQQPHRESPYLWIGQNGPLTASGVYQLVRRRSTQAGLKFSKALHIFRHSFSHHFRMGGGEEGDLQQLGGWKSRKMLERYGKSRAAERARVAHRVYGPGDRI